MTKVESPVERVISRELPDDFTMVEVGVGSHPFSPQPTVLIDSHMRLNPAFSFGGNRRYIGVDNGRIPIDHDTRYLGSPSDIITKAARKLLDFEARIKEIRPEDNISMHFTDVLDLGLEAGSVSEVMMSNVLSSGLEAREMQTLLDESARLLPSEGLLVTRETFTPWICPPDLLVPMLERRGFEPVEIFHSSEHRDQYNELANYYGPTLFDVDFGYGLKADRYFCLATRK